MNTPAKRSWIKPAAIAAVVAALGTAGYMSLNSAPVAPEVTYIALDGSKISSQSLRGKVVMVNFWATSCTTCVAEMPQMAETYKKFKDRGLEFVAVAMQYDPPNYVVNFTETRKLPFKVALDSGGDIARAFGGINATPTTYVIDQQGRIIKRYVGIPDFAGLHALLEKQLAGPA
jgi:peroxiredoxin